MGYDKTTCDECGGRLNFALGGALYCRACARGELRRTKQDADDAPRPAAHAVMDAVPVLWDKNNYARVGLYQLTVRESGEQWAWWIDDGINSFGLDGYAPTEEAAKRAAVDALIVEFEEGLQECRAWRAAQKEV